MNSFKIHYGNVTEFTMATLVALTIVFVIFGTLAVLNNAGEVQAPFLGTLLLTTVVAGIVGSVTTRTNKRTSGNILAEQRGNATFAFTNSTGTLVSLVGAAVESIELGEPKKNSGIMYLLESFFRLTPSNHAATYAAIVSILAIVAFALVIFGSLVMAREQQSNQSDIETLRWLSVLLMVLGLAGTSAWGTIPFGADEAADAWRTLAWAIIILFGGVSLVAAISIGARSLFSLIANGLIHLGQSMTSKPFWEKLLVSIRQIVVAHCRFLLVGLLLWMLVQTCGALLRLFPVEDLQDVFDTIQGNTDIVVGSFIRTGVFSALAALAFLLVALVPPAWRRLVQTLRTRSADFRFREPAIPKLKMFLDQLRRAIASQSAQAFRKSLGAIGTLLKTSVASVLVIQRSVMRLLRIAARAAAAYARPVAYLGPTIGRLAAGAVAIVLATSYIRAPVADYIDVDLSTPMPMQTVELPLVEIEFDPPVPTLPRLAELIRIRPISLCMLPPGALDWSFAETDRFEIAIDRCRIPSELIRAGSAVVLITLSSSQGALEAEEARSADRGRRLGNWAAGRLPQETDVYVLDLGKASGPRPLSRFASLFGMAYGERPVVGLLVSAEPAAAHIGSVDISTSLDRYILDRRLAASFSKCELWQLDARFGSADPFKPVSGFECGSR